MLFLLEGPEAAGKSTLAKTLSLQTGYPLIHMDKPHTKHEKLQMYQDYQQKIEEIPNGIFDRCWYSEIVYGPIMREGAYIDLDQMYNLETMLMARGAVIIHCTDAVDKLWARCNERGEDYITDIDTLAKITFGFHNLLQETAHLIPVTKYQVSGNRL